MKRRIPGFSAALVGCCLALSAEATLAAASQLDQQMIELAKRPTPKTADGRPDLRGIWFSYTGSNSGFVQTKLPDGSLVASLPQSVQAGPSPFAPTKDPPQYKPEFQAKLKQIQSINMNKVDNVFICGQPGLPRVGAPQQILQERDQVVFLYSDLNGMVFRVIPIGGKYRDTEPSYYGVGVGKWEGDTLVIDTRNFSTDTWIGEDGFFHSDQMRTIERLRRIGDTIEYQIAIEDPGVLTQPWVKPPYTMRKTDRALEEPFRCDYTDRGGLADDPRERHDQRVK